MIQHGHNTVVFVLNNGIYGVEQQGVNPNPFRAKCDKINYAEEYKGKPEE